MGRVMSMREMRNLHIIFRQEISKERKLCKERHRSDDNIQTNLRYVGCEGMDWI
jgi:hypothetical protein